MSAHSSLDAMPVPASDGRILLAQIRHMGRTLDDIENLRIRHANRRGAFERAHELPLPLPPDDLSLKLAEVEDAAKRELIRLWRLHPLAAWAKSVRGVGEKSMARLIAEIGGERVDLRTGEINRAPLDAPNVAKLWAFCGYDPERRRRRGMGQDDAFGCGSLRAKKQCWLIATRMLMCGNRDVYDARRAVTADRDWTPAHAHNDALRIVAKALLRDLWIASRQGRCDAHGMSAGGDPE